MLISLVKGAQGSWAPLYEKAPLWKLIFTSQNSAQHIIDAGKHIFVQGICSTLISIAISTISPTAPWSYIYTDFTVLVSFPDPHTTSTRLFESAFVWVFGSLRNPVSSEGHQDSLESNCTPLQNSEHYEKLWLNVCPQNHCCNYCELGWNLLCQNRAE